MTSPQEFARLLTEALHAIKQHERQQNIKKSISIVQQELATGINRSVYTLERWRKGYLPANPVDVEMLAQAIAARLPVEQRWLADFLQSGGHTMPHDVAEKLLAPTKRVSVWGDAPDTRYFCGREAEIEQVTVWLADEAVRVVGLLGMGGIGKTLLAKRISETASFEVVLWQSLLNTPKLNDVLAVWLRALSQQADETLPPDEGARLLHLLTYLRQHRCLLVLDNLESILQSQTVAGAFQPEYQGYEQLLRQLATTVHQSCLLLTSREKPTFILLEEGGAVRTLGLHGLPAETSQTMMRNHVEHATNPTQLHGSNEAWLRLTQHYSGNPLMLKLVANLILSAYEGNIDEFLTFEGATVGDVHPILAHQVDRLTDLEQHLLYWLAVAREPVTMSSLRQLVLPDLVKQVGHGLRMLQGRSLVEQSAGGSFGLQTVVLEYLTERLLADISTTLLNDCPDTTVLAGYGDWRKRPRWQTVALCQAQAKEYIRQSQIRTLLKPLAEKLTQAEGRSRLLTRLRAWLAHLRQQPQAQQGYGGGNLLNLLVFMQADLTGWDFSGLTLWQTHLQTVRLTQVNLAGADVRNSVFMETFGAVLSVAISPDGRLIAAGTSTGAIGLWYLKDFQQRRLWTGHTDWVRSVVFSPDGQTLATGSDDRLIKLWAVKTGELRQTMRGHTNWIWAVAFHPSQPLLASGGNETVIRLWDVQRGNCVQTLDGHTDWVRTIAFTPNGQHLVSGSDDATMRVWSVETGECQRMITGHTGCVWAVAVSPDGQVLASGSEDKSVRLWAVASGEALMTWNYHQKWVRSVAFSPDSLKLASGADDGTIRLWNLRSWQPEQIMQEHLSRVWAVQFDPTNQRLLSGSSDRSLRWWQLADGRCLRTVQGHINPVWAVDFDESGTQLASGHEDGQIRLWKVATGAYQGSLTTPRRTPIWSLSLGGRFIAACGGDQSVYVWDVANRALCQPLTEHTGKVRHVALSPVSPILASVSEDKTVRIWDVTTGRLRHTLTGHEQWVVSVAFSPDGRLVASSSYDQTVRVWDVETGDCRQTLAGQTNKRIWAVAFSPDSRYLASGGSDGWLRVWNISAAHCRQATQPHEDTIWSIAFSPDGQTVVSVGDDGWVNVWSLHGLTHLRRWSGHAEQIKDVAWHGQQIATASEDETVKLWDSETGDCRHTLQGGRLYEGLNIRNLTGLTESQQAMLTTLGAVR